MTSLIQLQAISGARGIPLTVDMIEAFAGVYLAHRYDQAVPTPQFHRECWSAYISTDPAVMRAAPRGHAKSTALTHVFGLATVCFRVESYVIVLGSTEELAIEHLGDIANELRENDDLRRDFKIKRFVTDAKTDIIVECEDGYQFRIIARGAEQKIRGKKWRGSRPGLILADDMEDDEQVESRDRRVKFRRWFFRAAKQALRRGGRIRVHGTILHEDSLLARLRKNKAWNARIYKAHRSFNEFTEILWPEAFTALRLKAIQQEFIDDQDAAGYSQEYLNDPFDNDLAYIRKGDMLPMITDEVNYHEQPMLMAVGVDFAISTKDKANRTSFSIGGKCADHTVCLVDQRVGRMDSETIVEEFFSIQSRWSPDMFFVEDGQIWLAILPMLETEMRRRGIFIAWEALRPTSDKAVRGRAFQKRSRAGMCRYDKDAEWYADFEYEVLRFTGSSEATLDDQFDSKAILHKGFEIGFDVDEEDFKDDDELEFEAEASRLRSTVVDSKDGDGRSGVTGY